MQKLSHLHLEQACKEGNFYHLHLNFPKITWLVFAEKDYFDMLFENVKKSSSPVVLLGLDLSLNKQIFLLHQEFKTSDDFPVTALSVLLRRIF